MLVAAFTAAFFMTESGFNRWQWSSLLQIPVLFIPNLMGGPLGEEAGWRGFALPRLQQLLSPVSSALVLGFFWANWHIPLILGHIYNVNWWQFTTLTIAAPVFLSLTFNCSGNSVLSAIFVHGNLLTNLKSKQGDCDCFALWTWREFLALRFDARFVVGISGRYGEGHAWVQFTKDGKHFLVDPTWANGEHHVEPQYTPLRPRFPVALDGNRISYYSHEARRTIPLVRKLIVLVADWLIFWSEAWTWAFALWPRYLYRRIVSNSRSAM